MATTYAQLVARNNSGASKSSTPYRDMVTKSSYSNNKGDGPYYYRGDTTSSGTSQSVNTSQPVSTPTVATTPSQTSASSSFNTQDRSTNPGEGYFWDAADGWKPINGGGSYDAELEAARKAEEERQARVRAAINAGWDKVDARLGEIEGRLPDQYSNQENQINNLYGSSSTKLDTARDYANKLINTNQKTTLSSLADNLRAAMQAGNTYLGARGASSSSANERYSTALLKQANKQQGNVMTQADAQRAQVQNSYDNNMAELEEWKNTKLYELGEWLNEQQNQLSYEKANASGQRAQAIANLEEQLHTTALQRLQQIESAVLDYKNTVNTWLLQQTQAINNGVSGINSTPQGLSYNSITGAELPSTTETTPLIGYGTSYNSTDDDNRGLTSLSNLYSRYSSNNPSINVPLTF